jgi:hypothetical protein
MPSMKNRLGPEYASLDDAEFIPKYPAACFCGTVRYVERGERLAKRENYDVLDFS